MPSLVLRQKTWRIRSGESNPHHQFKKYGYWLGGSSRLFGQTTWPIRHVVWRKICWHMPSLVLRQKTWRIRSGESNPHHQFKKYGYWLGGSSRLFGQTTWPIRHVVWRKICWHMPSLVLRQKTWRIRSGESNPHHQFKKYGYWLGGSSRLFGQTTWPIRHVVWRKICWHMPSLVRVQSPPPI